MAERKPSQQPIKKVEARSQKASNKTESEEWTVMKQVLEVVIECKRKHEDLVTGEYVVNGFLPDFIYETPGVGFDK